ncbi:hypothetical protein AYO43_07870 [Nitrospira sp. SCGC AG-212-E16]|nr:hypothetical protein AYO43_07870 [Nitrospira sp. SCGC AG-212-E16]
MDFYKVALAVMIVIPVASPVLAQSIGTEVQRDINQETRVEQGLKSGQLNTGEAAKLERGEARIDRMESKALKNGNLSQQEAARIQDAQNRESDTINRMKHNDVTGNPNSASSQRMQADVQRNMNQQGRIEQGVQSGSLTKKEVSQLEHGQARVSRAEARAGANGQVGAREQARIQNRENKQSQKIFREKHNNRMR